MHDPSTSQLVEHIHSIVRHVHLDSPSGNLHVQNMELVQCYVGSAKPFWDLPFADYGNLAPRGWMAFTWHELSETNLSLHGPLATIKPRRQGDRSLTDLWVDKQVEPSKRKLLNEVRLHLGVTYVSDLCNAADTHIHPGVWNCIRHSSILPGAQWPNTKAPGRNAKASWQTMLQSLLIVPGHSHRQLVNSLGEWLKPDDDQWIWWHDPAADILWERKQQHEWHSWTALPPRYQQQRYSHAVIAPGPPPGDSIRATVRVSGRVARLQDTRGSLPAPLLLAPTTMKEAIQALPPTCQWAVQHAQSSDDGATVALAISQGKAVAVSDGSLRYTLGTSAYVIEGESPAHRIIGYNRVPGPIVEGDSHRCELAGLYAIVNVVNSICKLHQVTQGSITVACDNTSALKPTAEDFLPHPRQKNLDLMQALWKSLQDSPITWKPVHVYGHQDKKIKDSHRRLSNLNCQMDALAKQYWAHLFHLLPPGETPHIPIYNEGWSIWLRCGGCAMIDSFLKPWMLLIGKLALKECLP